MSSISKSFLNAELYKVIRSTIHRMLTDRGYERQQQSSLLPELYERGSDRIMVTILVPEDQQKQDGIEVFKDIVAQMVKSLVHHAVVATLNGFTHHVGPFLEDIKDFNHIEVFRFHELISPVVDHQTVPLHVKIDEEEKEDLYLKLGISKENERFILPIMKYTDPVARYYRYDVGDVIRIHRANTGDIYYRIVSE
jgi:DNA-directed RNA polymerase subunit H (RpoH/RPB5)